MNAPDAPGEARRATLRLALLACAALSMPAFAVSTGEHLAYVVGCVNCHHQTPRDIINAPALVIAKTYSLAEFRTLMKTGVTRTGRNLPKMGSIMGIVAVEQFARMTDAEVVAIHAFLTTEWTPGRAAVEEAKIPGLYGARKEKSP